MRQDFSCFILEVCPGWGDWGARRGAGVGAARDDEYVGKWDGWGGVGEY